MPEVDFSLKDKVAIVTGGSRGIGESIAKAFAQFGAKVVVASRKMEGLEKVAGEIKADGGECTPIVAHGGKIEDIDNLLAKTKEIYGRVDIVVNNAATNPFFGKAIETPLPALDKTLEVNLRGYYYTCQAAAKLFIEQGHGGNIINVASIAGLRPGIGESIYATTKAAVINMTKSFAKECGPEGIRVNAIAPGLVETYFAGALMADEEQQKRFKERSPMRRWGQPNEISGAAVFLASPAGGYANGSVIVLDGGSMA